MKKQITITVPTNWSAITLKKYIQLQKDLESYKGDEEATFATILYHLCGIDPNLLSEIDSEVINRINEDLNGFLQNTDIPLQRIITIDGVEYGFEPNLSKMAYGAYVDIGKYETIEINEKWAEIMSILYRPVSKKIGKLYEIQPYEGNIDGDKFLNVDMGVHWGAQFFFINLLNGLLKNTLNSLTQTALKDLPHNTKSIFQRSGKAMLQLLNLPKETLRR